MPLLFEAVEEVVTAVTRTLPPGVAELTVDRNEEREGRRTILVVTPANPSAARIHVEVEEQLDVVAVSLGRGAIFEVPAEGHRYTDLDCLDEVRALCVAAIRGELRETVLFKGDEVVGADATIKIGSIETGDSWRQFTNPLRRPVKRSFDYEPYASD